MQIYSLALCLVLLAVAVEEDSLRGVTHHTDHLIITHLPIPIHLNFKEHNKIHKHFYVKYVRLADSAPLTGGGCQEGCCTTFL